MGMPGSCHQCIYRGFPLDLLLCPQSILFLCQRVCPRPLFLAAGLNFGLASIAWLGPMSHCVELLLLSCRLVQKILPICLGKGILWMWDGDREGWGLQMGVGCSIGLLLLLRDCKAGRLIWNRSCLPWFVCKDIFFLWQRSNLWVILGRCQICRALENLSSFCCWLTSLIPTCNSDHGWVSLCLLFFLSCQWYFGVEY